MRRARLPSLEANARTLAVDAGPRLIRLVDERVEQRLGERDVAPDVLAMQEVEGSSPFTALFGRERRESNPRSPA
jgi:hypothetical protein